MIGFKIRRMTVATFDQARVLVEYRVLIEEPKSHNGKRTGQASPCIPSGYSDESGRLLRRARAAADHRRSRQ
jgi:hypothetical protein